VAQIENTSLIDVKYDNGWQEDLNSIPNMIRDVLK
jgi:hypothetical protein